MDAKPADEPQSVIARLIERMDADPGFAGLGASVHTITTLSDEADNSGRTITEAILRDAALAARLLRLANSSYHGRGSRNVSTIDQALVILGLKTVKSVALSLALLNSLSNKPQSNLLHAEIVASYFCGALASEITRISAPRFNAQEAQVCGLLQNLGRMMALYYLYEDIERSRALQIEENIAEDEAVERTLGMSFAEIGAAIAKHWQLPFVIQQSLEPLVAKTPPRTMPANAVGWHQTCTTFARRITDTLFRQPNNRERADISAAIEFFHMALRLKDDEARERVEFALTEAGNQLSATSFPCSVDSARSLLRKTSERALDILSSQDKLTRTSNELAGKSPIEMINYTLRQVHERYGFDRTLLCLPDGPAKLMAIAGVGQSISQITPKFRCFGPKPDLFRIVLAKNKDVFIPNVKTPAYEKLFPEWYSALIGAQACVLLPLVLDGKPLGLLYADYAAAPETPPADFNAGDMKTWREQLQMCLLAGITK